MGSTNFSEAAEMDAALTALKLTTIAALPMVLNTVIELDLLEFLAKAGPEAGFSASDLAAQVSAKNPDAAVMLDRMLCLLSSFSVLNCTVKHMPDGAVERVYGLAPVGKYFTKDKNGGSMAGLLLLTQNKTTLGSWHYCKEAILEGEHPFKRAYGMNLFEYLGKDSSLRQAFNNALYDYSGVLINKVLEVYDGFQGLQTLVDMGGGLGATLSIIVSKYPGIKGINFDLPHVVKDAPSYPGVVHVGGDMFKSVPKGDAIFMKNILHNWSDEECVRMLKKCYESLPENGKVIIADHICYSQKKKKGNV